MKKYILSVACAVFATFGLQSCLDFDIPGDEFTGNDELKDDVVYHGQADLIDYHKEISEEGFAKAETALSRTFGQLLTAQYSMRGGKEGNSPVAMRININSVWELIITQDIYVFHIISMVA